MASEHEYQACSQEFVCENRGQPGFKYHEDTQDANYLQNWMQEMDLSCVDRSQINLIYIPFCIGSIVQSFLFATLPDRRGNKATIKLVSTINLAAQIIALLVPVYTVRALCFFVMGLCFLKYTTPYAWLSGFVTKSN